MATVLYIEDEPVNRKLVRKVLEADGLAVIEAIDGISGIREALSSAVDLILLDIGLPDMDGYEVTLKLRGELAGRDVPIAAVTGKGDSRMLRAVGCDALISKPIDVDALPGKVRELLREARTRDGDASATESDRLLVEQSRKLASRLQAKIEELEQTNRRLVESEKVRADFYRNLSHELSTPLTPAVGYLNMLMDEELGILTPLQKRALGSIERGVRRVRSVVENLLDMTALTTGKMVFDVRPYDFNKQAREAVELCRERFEERGITLETAVAEVPFRAFGDPEKLGRAMVQLLENAVKFCKGGGRVHTCTRRAKGELSFLVYDAGEGIPPDELHAIFRTFYQIDGSPTREHGGAGLGLALARKIVDRFEGEIWAESPPESAKGNLAWARTMVGLRVPERMPGDHPAPSER
jgi:signal transduction histidine kinase